MLNYQTYTNADSRLLYTYYTKEAETDQKTKDELLLILEDWKVIVSKVKDN